MKQITAMPVCTSHPAMSVFLVGHLHPVALRSAVLSWAAWRHRVARQQCLFSRSDIYIVINGRVAVECRAPHVGVLLPVSVV